MPDNFNTIQGTEVINVNDAIQGSHAITLDTLKTFTDIGVPGELVFEAYVRQTGGDDPQGQTSGVLVVGTSYNIYDYILGDDFTNVGAASNTNGTYFIATGTTPAVWTNSSGIGYNSGLPTCSYILKNTLGVTGFIEYSSSGQYILSSNGAFTSFAKTFVTFGTPSNGDQNAAICIWKYLSTSAIRIVTLSNGSETDNTLNCYMKIVVLP